MLCYRCGSHVPDKSETCPTCGQRYETSTRQATGGFSRRGEQAAPYKPGDMVALRYAVMGVLGAGPLGHVLKVHDRETDTEVALKVVHPRLVQAPEERTQFSQALRAGRTPGHPHLLGVLEVGLDRDCPYFTTELLLQGTTLRKMMQARAARRQHFSLPELEPLLAALASALDEAHRTGPHADLKPENIFILPGGVKVTDRGLGLGIPRLPFIQAQKYARADCYLAPEYLEGGDFDTRMDLYSLAAIVGELLTGQTPTEGTPPPLEAHPELPAAFVGLCRRALNANPLVRPATAGEFFREYLAVLGRKPAPVQSAAPVEARTRPQPEVSPAHAALVAAARGGEKPPPPVPTHQIPVASLVPAAPHPEATQPMDAQQLASLMGASPGASEPPRASAPAPAPAPAPVSVVSTPRPRPAPPPRAMPPVALPVPASARAAPASRPLPRLALLALAGVLTGSAVGYFVLRPAPKPAAPQASQPPTDAAGAP